MTKPGQDAHTPPPLPAATSLELAETEMRGAGEAIRRARVEHMKAAGFLDEVISSLGVEPK